MGNFKNLHVCTRVNGELIQDEADYCFYRIIEVV